MTNKIQKFKPNFWPALKVKEDQLPIPFNGCVKKAAFAIGAWADGYASLSRNEIHLKERNPIPMKVEGYAWKTAAKVVSYILTFFTLPIFALIAKALYKDYCSKNIEVKIQPSSNKEVEDKEIPENELDKNKKESHNQSALTSTPISTPTIPPTLSPTTTLSSPNQEDNLSQKTKSSSLKSVENIETQAALEVNKIIKSYKIGKTVIHVKERINSTGGITKDDAEVLVNAANHSLVGQGTAGVCADFYQDAGQEIFDECTEIKEATIQRIKSLENDSKEKSEEQKKAIQEFMLGIVPPAFTAMTTSGKLKQSKAVIHAVGPKNSDDKKEELMKQVIENCLKMSTGFFGSGTDFLYSKKLPKNPTYRSIAFPAISTGIYGYKIAEAAPIVAKTVDDFIQKFPDALDSIHFVFLNRNEDSAQTAKGFLTAFDAQFSKKSEI